ncbi:histone-fold-containing protein [Astrocystis sublimbata]|nr:histone-fold-containing protein [Astrocystis sublimbata]
MSDSPQSPPKDVEPGVQSPDDEAQMNDPQDPHAAGLSYEFEVKEQDRWLPIANGAHDPMILAAIMSHDSPTQAPEAPRASKAHKYDVYDANIRNFAPVARIMKLALPENAKIAKEAKECMQECVSEFISFITSEASEKCQQEKRKTVNGEDILFAMTSLGFENYAEALKIYLTKYREVLSAPVTDPHICGMDMCRSILVGTLSADPVDQQSQSNRGESQQNRPGSQGYGAATAGASNAVGSSSFQGGDASAGLAESGESYMYAQAGHNGAGGEPANY